MDRTAPCTPTPPPLAWCSRFPRRSKRLALTRRSQRCTLRSSLARPPMTLPSDLWKLSASELAVLVRSREVSATQAAQSALARLDAVNAKLNAVVDHRPDEVLARAQEVDQALARGEE